MKRFSNARKLRSLQGLIVARWKLHFERALAKNILSELIKRNQSDIGIPVRVLTEPSKFDDYRPRLWGMPNGSTSGSIITEILNETGERVDPKLFSRNSLPPVFLIFDDDIKFSQIHAVDIDLDTRSKVPLLKPDEVINVRKQLVNNLRLNKGSPSLNVSWMNAHLASNHNEFRAETSLKHVTAIGIDSGLRGNIAKTLFAKIHKLGGIEQCAEQHLFSCLKILKAILDGLYLHMEIYKETKQYLPIINKANGKFYPYQPTSNDIKKLYDLTNTILNSKTFRRVINNPSDVNCAVGHEFLNCIPAYINAGTHTDDQNVLKVAGFMGRGIYRGAKWAGKKMLNLALDSHDENHEIHDTPINKHI